MGVQAVIVIVVFGITAITHTHTCNVDTPIHTKKEKREKERLELSSPRFSSNARLPVQPVQLQRLSNARPEQLDQLDWIWGCGGASRYFPFWDEIKKKLRDARDTWTPARGVL